LDTGKLEGNQKALKLDSEARRNLVNESHFFESVIGYINHIIRTLVFALTLLVVSPGLIKVDVLVSIVYVFFISKQRFKKGLHVSSEDRMSKQGLKGKRKDKDFSQDFDIFVKRSWLSAKLDSGHLSIFILLIIAPFLLSDIFSLRILDKIVLFNFTTLLIFFSNAIHLAIQSANIGFRFHTVFGSDELSDDEEDEQ